MEPVDLFIGRHSLYLSMNYSPRPAGSIRFRRQISYLVHHIDYKQRNFYFLQEINHICNLFQTLDQLCLKVYILYRGAADS